MIESGLRFFGLAVGRVDSTTAIIYLECIAWLCRPNATALIHRAIAEPGSTTSKNKIKKVEKQTFTALSLRLQVSRRDIYDMANNNTVIEPQTKLGRKFFLNLN